MSKFLASKKTKGRRRRNKKWDRSDCKLSLTIQHFAQINPKTWGRFSISMSRQFHVIDAIHHYQISNEKKISRVSIHVKYKVQISQRVACKSLRLTSIFPSHSLLQWIFGNFSVQKTLHWRIFHPEILLCNLISCLSV